MPDVYIAPREGAPATEPAGALAAFTRDDPRYWDARRPLDHGPDGLYREGPREAKPITTALAKLERARCREQPETPTAARAQMQLRQQRAQKAVAEAEAIRRRPAQRLVAEIPGTGPFRRNRKRAA